LKHLSSFKKKSKEIP